MHHKFRYAMQIVFTCVVTIASWGYVKGTAVTVISDGEPTVRWGTVEEANENIVYNTLFVDVIPSVSKFSSNFKDGPILKLTVSMDGDVAYVDDASDESDSSATSDETFAVAHGIHMEGGYFSSTPTTKIIAFGHETKVCAGDEIVTPTSIGAGESMLMTFSCDTGADDDLIVEKENNFIFLIGHSTGHFYPQCGMTLKSGVIYNSTPEEASSTISASAVNSATAATMQCECTVSSSSAALNGRTLTMKLDVLFAAAIPYIVFYFTKSDGTTSITATDSDWKENAQASFTATIDGGSPLSMSKAVNSYVGVAATDMAYNETVDFVIDDFPSDKFDPSTANKIMCYAYHTDPTDVVAASATVAANYVTSPTAGTFDIGDAKALSSANLEVEWGTTTTSKVSLNGAETLTSQFPSSFALDVADTSFVIGVDRPMLRFKFDTDTGIDLAKAGDSAKVAYSLYFTGGHAKDGNYYVIVSDTSTQVSNGASKATFVGQGSADSSFYQDGILGVTSGTAGSGTASSFAVYVTGEKDTFYPQCGMTVTGLVQTVSSSDAAIASSSSDFGIAASASPECGCSILADTGVSYSSDKLKVKITITGAVEPPYVVFQLYKKDERNSLLIDTTVANTSMDKIIAYATTWSEAKDNVKVAFTKTDGTLSNSENATVPDLGLAGQAKADFNQDNADLMANGISNVVGFKTVDGDDKIKISAIATAEMDLKSEYCLSAEDSTVQVKCFLYHSAPTKDKVSEKFAANFVQDSASTQSFECTKTAVAADDPQGDGATAKIGFSVFLLALTALVMEF